MVNCRFSKLVAISLGLASVALLDGRAIAEESSQNEQPPFIKEVKTLIRDGNYERALSVLEPLNYSTLESDAVRNEQQKLLGDAYNNLKRYDEAIASFSNVISYPGTDKVFALVNRCYSYLQLNLLVDARRDCGDARYLIERIDGDGATVPLHRVVGLLQVQSNVFREEGNLDEALSSIEMAAEKVRAFTEGLNKEELDREQPSLQYFDVFVDEIQTLAEYRDIGRAKDRANELLRASEASFPWRVPDVLAEIGALHKMQRDFDAAGRFYITAYNMSKHGIGNFEYFGSSEELVFLACISYLQSSDVEAAVDNCEELANYDPSNLNFLEFYGVSLARAARYHEALATFETILANSLVGQARHDRAKQRIESLKASVND